MPELYEENISHRVKTIEDSYGSVLDEYTANEVTVAGFGLLLDFENSGRRDEGWRLYWQLTDPSNWTDLNPAAEKIIIEKRATHREQYESGKPFG